MKVLMINVVCGIRSTGRICTDLASALEKQGNEVKVAYGREDVPECYQKSAVRVGSDLDVVFHGFKKLIMDEDGRGSKRVTERFLKWVREYDPDVIHLHNVLGYYINIPLLFDYLKQSKKRVIWTLHDCSAFTGGCAYFEYAGCKRWQESCGKCPQRGSFPKRRLSDHTAKILSDNRILYSGLDDLTIVTPSEWLVKYVEQSFLNQYPSIVIHNGVNTDCFYNNGR